MHKIVILICVVGLGFFLAFLDNTAPPKGKVVGSKQNTPLATLKQAPNAEFKGINEKRYSLHQFKGRTVLLNFWATWCTPCIVELPLLLELAKREQDDIVFIALSVDENPRIVNNFLKKLPTEVQKKLKLENVIIGLDSDKEISKNMFKTIMYPETFIINENMMIKQKIEGVTDWLNLEIKSLP